VLVIPGFAPDTAFLVSLSLFPSDFDDPSDERESSRMLVGGSRLRRPQSGFYSQAQLGNVPRIEKEGGKSEETVRLDRS
jgi:hypothetical protein